MSDERTYIAIDLKSFYASVECRERNLNPLTTNLVVADPTRTEKTICLAVTPSLKAYGVSGRARLFEVISKVRAVNAERKRKIYGREFSGSSVDSLELSLHSDFALDFIIAPPRMSLYMQYSTLIYQVYLRHIAPEDIHVYSIDEVFIDATAYLKRCRMTAREFTKMLITDVLDETGITAAAGIGTNLYLCKVAMDITAKHIPEDKDGVRIAELCEKTYRETLWNHRPLTDFWRVGKGYAKALESHGMYTMGDIARCSMCGEDLLYHLFGVNAELLIDHAWGWEPCTIADIKAYKPSTNSINSGQVLQSPYDFDKTRLIVMEMIDHLVLDLVEKGLVTNQLVLIIGYDSKNLNIEGFSEKYTGEITTDMYGRKIPKNARGNVNLGQYTSSTRIIMEKVLSVFDKIADKNLLSRRINISACNLIDEREAVKKQIPIQLDIFTDYSELEKEQEREKEALGREKNKQKAMIEIKNKYGKNAILKGMNFEEGATAKDRNGQIGGHKA
ncbi:MAG: DNA methylase [Clostridia bacterium]|nr:DNA methylase [Clostridia bacterium]